PTYLYYNPYDENKQIEYFNEDAPVDLYDAISHRIVARHVTEEGCFDLPAKSAMLIVVVPSESQLEKRGERIMLDTVVIAYK
ncbi:MAG: hypothetical protein JW801_15160, partial [Bacteroidales bacterium]|nr:hypothetical protein [Bacteroidales bacterium]